MDWLEYVNWIDYTDEEDTERIKKLMQSLIVQKRHSYDVKRSFQQLRDTISRYAED